MNFSQNLINLLPKPLISNQNRDIFHIECSSRLTPIPYLRSNILLLFFNRRQCSMVPFLLQNVLIVTRLILHPVFQALKFTAATSASDHRALPALHFARFTSSRTGSTPLEARRSCPIRAKKPARASALENADRKIIRVEMSIDECSANFFTVTRARRY